MIAAPLVFGIFHATTVRAQSQDENAASDSSAAASATITPSELNTPTYAGSKAGLRLFAEALGLRLKKHGVAVTLVSPGFIDTPMSRKVTQPKPFLMDVDKAAIVITRKIQARARVIVVPWQFAVIRAFTDLLPRALVRWVMSRA